MPLISIIIVLIVLGVLLYIVESLLPMDPTIRTVVRIVILLAVCIWLLSLIGLIPGTIRVSLLPRWRG